MHIGIEATSAVDPQKAGVGYYALNLLRELCKLGPQHHTYTCYFRKTPPDLARIFQTGSSLPPHIIPKVLHFPKLWAQSRLPLELWRHPQDVYFFPAPVLPLLFQPENSVMTVHDVAFLFFQEYFSPLLRKWLTIATERGIRRSQKVIAVSETTRQDILAYYEVEPEKVVTIHHGVHERFRPVPQEDIERVRKTYQIAGEYILCVGTLQKRKNLPRLLQAFYMLKQKHGIPHKLVLVGAKFENLPEGGIFSTIERLFLQEEVIWTGYAAGRDIPALLSGATVFALPSLYEGFGMPILEAMACEVPVVCSNTSSFPEVAGDSSVMFDPTSVESIACELLRVLADQELQSELRHKGVQRAAHFSWRTCAQKTLHVLESVS